jgi:hypothetical protein
MLRPDLDSPQANSPNEPVFLAARLFPLRFDPFRSAYLSTKLNVRFVFGCVVSAGVVTSPVTNIVDVVPSYCRKLILIITNVVSL